MPYAVKRKLVLVAVALAVAAFAGGAYAASQAAPPNLRMAFFDDVARRLNVAPSRLRDAFKQAFYDQLATAVAAGRLSTARAMAIKQRVDRTGFVPFGVVFGRYGPYSGAPLFGDPVRRRLNAAGMRSVSGYLGEPRAQLRAELRAGRSLAQITRAREKRLLTRLSRRVDRVVQRVR